MSQSSFSDLEYQQKKKPTRKEKFLGEMEQVIPWKKAYALIRGYYPKAGNGRQPMPLETMLRIYFLQHWYGLSDPAMEDLIGDIAPRRIHHIEALPGQYGFSLRLNIFYG